MIRYSGEAECKVLAKSPELRHRLESSLLPKKIESIVVEFTETTVASMMEEFAGQTLDQITPDNYKSTVAAIARVEEDESIVNIEADLRQEIREKHQLEFGSLIENLRESGPAYDPSFKDRIVHDLKAEHGFLRSKEKKIKDQITGLRGPSNEKAQDAWEALNKAKEELSQDGSKLQDFKNAEDAYKVINGARRSLFKELAAVHQRMSEIENTLATSAKIELAIWNLLRTTGEKSLRFYVELNNAVDRNNAVERFNAMRAIIGD